MQKTLKYTIITILIIAFIAAMWYIFDSSQQTLIKELQKYEQQTRDSIIQEVKDLQLERIDIYMQIETLSAKIEASDKLIQNQIQQYRNETFKNIRDYRDSSDNALLNRLRAR